MDIKILKSRYQRSHKIVIILFLLVSVIGVSGQEPGIAPDTFTNPLFNSGPDPWIVRNGEFYYYVYSSGGGISIRKGKNLDDLKISQPKSIWKPPTEKAWSKEIWAPEMHFLNSKWYIYFAADDGKNMNHRMYVIENSNADPTAGEWEFKGKVSDPSDKWAIDGSVIEFSSNLYMVWSGWEGDINGQQNIYLALLKNPWTIDGNLVKISSPEYKWETIGDLNNANDVPHVNVNEGPVALQHKKNLFIIYSASGCWTDDYCLGMLTFTGKDNLLDPSLWKKNPLPVFKGKAESGAYSPGHNSFFKSPDGKEDWIVYHANPEKGQGCGRNRSPRAQRFGWKKDGTPDFGEPVQIEVPVALPSSGK